MAAAHPPLASRRVGMVALAAVLLSTWFGAAHGQGYPNRPVRVIVPTGAGGSNDLIARAIGVKLAEAWGQPVVVDNRAGAAGTIGADLVAKAAPDGYTLALVASTFAANPAISAKLPFDPIRDFAPVSHIASSQWVVVVPPTLPATSMAEFIQLARKRPGQMNYASTGEGSVIHLAGELLASMAGIELKHIPYKSTAQGVNDVIAGRIEMTITSLAAAMPQATAGKLRVLAVTSLNRSPQFPNIPSVSETVAGFEFDNWFGVLAPRGTPPEIVVQIRDAFAKAMQTREVTQMFLAQSIAPVGSTPAQFADKIRREIEKYGKLAKALGLSQ